MLKKQDTQIKIEGPKFIRLKPAKDTKILSEHLHKQAAFLYGITKETLYTFSRKGWDVRKGGREMLFVNELRLWVPSFYFDIVDTFIPN